MSRADKKLLVIIVSPSFVHLSYTVLVVHFMIFLDNRI